ncbi:MAG: tRNA threonylcarbamoyladenosine dehydratase [Bdellovibrionota bacterium]|nr:hypothetical protein [Pseudobdellovibrionaceae bacterium]|tara:strand:+ start:77697 stop:78467 length:771 start_codon:yes stop_codon:yes gene_type:complete
MDFDFRFGGIRRLYGIEAFQKIQNAKVTIVGLGGVGSWAVEALARTGYLNICLVDMDDICESNINRQLQALGSSVGKTKGEELKKRIEDINPNCKVDFKFDFFTSDSVDEILSKDTDLVLDCIDSLKNKCLLLAECKKREIKVITCGGAGGKLDPGKIEIKDLSKTSGDPLLAKLRKKLRQDFSFKTNGSNFNIPCVFSTEQAIYPTGDGCVTLDKTQMDSTKLDCASGFGAITHLTGSFGFRMVHEANRLITEKV